MEFQLFARKVQKPVIEFGLHDIYWTRLTEQHVNYIVIHPKLLVTPIGMVQVCTQISPTLLETLVGSRDFTQKYAKPSVQLFKSTLQLTVSSTTRRLTRKSHETASIHDFKYGISDRGLQN